MTQQQHPIAPPEELVRAWLRETKDDEPTYIQLADKAAQWGADQELEACLNWLTNRERFPVGHEAIEELKADRRPKPPSLKEEALAIIDDSIEDDPSRVLFALDEIKTIRRALEQLPTHD